MTTPTGWLDTMRGKQPVTVDLLGDPRREAGASRRSTRGTRRSSRSYELMTHAAAVAALPEARRAAEGKAGPAISSPMDYRSPRAGPGGGR